MEPMNIIVGQSGGPTAVINSSLCGVIREGLEQSSRIDRIYGMLHGVEGFLQDEVVRLNVLFAQEEEQSALRRTPAAFLGSCRYKLPESGDDPVYEKVFQKLHALKIRAFLYIGGNDSMDTVGKLSRAAKNRGEQIQFIGIPKTIDNDLVGTDHTPGYGSAAKYIGATVRDISLDAGVYRQSVVTIIEIMGRHAGWLTAASALARTAHDPNPLLIYLPETPFDVQIFLAQLKNALKISHSVVVCVSEGILDEKGKLICEYGGETGVDGFGHKMLAGSAKVLERIVKETFGIKCRSIELNLPQRCSSVLASGTDLLEAEMVGRTGVRAALSGETGKMVCMERVPDESKAHKYRQEAEDGVQPYCIRYCLKNVAEICNKEKKFPQEWITMDGSDVSAQFLDYVRPLIQGEARVRFVNGLPEYVSIER